MKNHADVHPAVLVCFFAGAIGFGAVFRHPAYVLAGLACSAGFYLLLRGKRGLRTLAAFLPVCFFLMAVNPLLNTQGTHVLGMVFGRPYTAEALLYGAVIAGMLLSVLLWFGCLQQVLPQDRWVGLFGGRAPSITLFVCMTLRLIPELSGRAERILTARRAIGRGAEGGSLRQKLSAGMEALSALASWALEGSVVTADSMRARGYGTGRRSSFLLCRMRMSDGCLLAWMAFFAAAVTAFAASGAVRADFTPEFCVAPVSGRYAWGLCFYCGYLLIPIVLHCKEAVQWHISRSGI